MWSQRNTYIQNVLISRTNGNINFNLMGGEKWTLATLFTNSCGKILSTLLELCLTASQWKFLKQKLSKLLCKLCKSPHLYTYNCFLVQCTINNQTRTVSARLPTNRSPTVSARLPTNESPTVSARLPTNESPIVSPDCQVMKALPYQPGCRRKKALPYHTLNPAVLTCL